MENYQINLWLYYCVSEGVFCCSWNIYVFLTTHQTICLLWRSRIVTSASKMIERGDANFGESDNKCVEALR